MPPETVADLGQLTRRLNEMQAVPSLRLLPGVRFLADQILHLATGYYHLRTYDKAMQLLNRPLKLNPDDAAIYYSHRAVASRYLGQLERSMRDLDRALEIKSDYGDAHFNQACIYSLINRPDDALESLQKAIIPDPEHLANAKTDPDFDSIRDDCRFRELVGE